MARESAKIKPRWPSWSQDGADMAPSSPTMHQHGFKRSLTWFKRAATWSPDGQVAANMDPSWPQDAKDAPTWADICAYLEKPSFSFSF